MEEKCALVRYGANEYVSGKFPGFCLIGDNSFANLSAGFLINSYSGRITRGIPLAEFKSSRDYSSPSVSMINLSTGSSENSFQSYLLNNVLLDKFVLSLFVKAEKEKSLPIMRRSDLSDFFSGRGRNMAMVENTCPKRFSIPACVSGKRVISGVILDNIADNLAINYILENKLV